MTFWRTTSNHMGVQQIGGISTDKSRGKHLTFVLTDRNQPWGASRQHSHTKVFARIAVHAGFEKVGVEPCNAGIVSKQFEELTSCKPGGNDSPKLRTASFVSDGMYCDRSWLVSSAVPRAVNREIACSRTPSSISRERSSVRRAISSMVEIVAAVNVDNSSRDFSHLPAVSAATTECSGPYSGMRAPIRPSDHIQIASAGCFLIFARSSRPSRARVLAGRCSRLATRRHASYSN